MSESEKNHKARIASGFYAKYMRGSGLDVGYLGYVNSNPVTDNALGVDNGFPGYDGVNLPFADNSRDFIYTSHVLEHIKDFVAVIREWHRVVKLGGFIITIVPHKFLYEKKNSKPSIFNDDHKRFYTPAGLLTEFELSLAPNTYRVRHLRDNDDNFNYLIPPGQHSSGSYEIEMVAQKIGEPAWKIL